MAVLQVTRGLTLMLIVFYQGCHSQMPQCGVAVNNNRIVGGQDAVPDSWPWHAALNISGSIECGGSLINNQWVLTAARCLGVDQENNSNTQVVLGLHDKSNPGPDVVTMSVEEIICHPDYSYQRGFNNDICLLKLSAPVNFSTSIQPICLSSRNSTFHTGDSSWVIGFGEIDDYSHPDILHEVNVPIMGNNECHCYHNYITENMICAGVESGGSGSCLGDRGAPLMTKVSTSWVQVGVFVNEYSCGYYRNPGIYTHVSLYEDWIKEHVNGSDVGFVTFTSTGFDSDSSFICTTTPPPTSTSTYPSASTYPYPYTSTYPYPYTSTYPYPYNVTIRDDDSVFSSGENLIHITHFFSLCVVGLSLHVLVGGDLM